jgi:chorismate dehydratase
LFLDPASRGLLKVDLGTEWVSLTGVPFVWAFWAGRAGVLAPADVDRLVRARDEGVAASDAVADAYCGPERAAAGRAYLRENIQDRLQAPDVQGLRLYYELAEKHGVVESAWEPEFY